MQIKFNLNIETGNAAFTDGGMNYQELAECLRKVAKQIDYCYESGYVQDSNGNTVGNFELCIEESESEEEDWLDHSVNCSRCEELVDERDALTQEEGSICKGCKELLNESEDGDFWSPHPLNNDLDDR